jgi:hypothetical protein
VEQTDLQADGRLLCKFRVPPGLDAARFEALALLRLPNGTVYCGPKSQLFTFAQGPGVKGT